MALALRYSATRAVSQTDGNLLPALGVGLGPGGPHHHDSFNGSRKLALQR